MSYSLIHCDIFNINQRLAILILQKLTDVAKFSTTNIYTQQTPSI